MMGSVPALRRPVLPGTPIRLDETGPTAAFEGGWWRCDVGTLHFRAGSNFELVTEILGQYHYQPSIAKFTFVIISLLDQDLGHMAQSVIDPECDDAIRWNMDGGQAW